MKNSFDEIEKYLNNQMDFDEKRAFEIKLQQDVALRDDLEVQQLEHDAMELLIEKDLRAKMSSWSNSQTNKKSPLRIAYLKVGVAMAAILVGIVFFSKMLIPSATLPQDEITQTNTSVPSVIDTMPIIVQDVPKKKAFQKQQTNDRLQKLQDLKLENERYMAIAETAYGEGSLFKNTEIRGEITDFDNYFQSAIVAYNAKKYSVALENIEKMSDNELNRQVLFLKANVLMQQKNYKSALDLFSRFVENKDILFAEKSEFYIALCNIALNNIKGAKENIRKITENSEHIFYSEAIEIQKQLK